MAKYHLSKDDLQAHWNDQLLFIINSIREFDKGNEKEARRIANSLRILFHNTSMSKSIYSQLEKNMYFYSNSSYTPGNLLSSWTLLMMAIGPNSVRYTPLIDNPQRTFLFDFEDWWNEIIFDDLTSKFSRKDIILFVANQDGGAHVDSDLSSSFAELTKHNSLGWSNGMGNAPDNNPAYQAIRAIASELIITLDIDRKTLNQQLPQKDRCFEMRLVDSNGRRYLWSSTDIVCSEEMMKIVNQDTRAARKLFVLVFDDNLKFEYVGS